MSQLEQILVDCLALAAQNKITAKNSWSLQLLENIDGIIDSTKQCCDFVYVSSAISASAKIYAGRVDSLYTMTQHTAAAGHVHDYSTIDIDDVADTNSSQAQRSLEKRTKTVRRAYHKETILTKDFSTLQMKPASRDTLFRLNPLYSQLQMRELLCTTKSLPIFSIYNKPATLSVSDELSNRILANVRPITTHMIQAAQASLIATPLVAPSGSLNRSFITTNPMMQSQYGNFSSRIESAVHSVSNSLVLSQDLQENVARYVENSDHLSVTEDLIAVSGNNVLWTTVKIPKHPKKQRVAKRANSQSTKKNKIANLPRAPRIPQLSTPAASETVDNIQRESVEATLSDCSVTLDVDELDFELHHNKKSTLEHANSPKTTLDILDLHTSLSSAAFVPFNSAECILNMAKTEIIDSTPTKINMAQLKSSIYKHLTHQTTITELLTLFPRMHYVSNDIINESASSVSLVFSALLHLASEGFIDLEPNHDNITIIPQH